MHVSSDIDEISTVLEPSPMPGFVETPYVRNLTKRALIYIKSGFPIHLRGASGTGKTTLALHIAYKLSRPLVLIHGDEQYSTSDLIGGEHGYRFKKIRDNFIHSVLKEEESMAKSWVDSRLTVACKYGLTLVYDEYTRSRPEANNVLLPILQEKTMSLPPNRPGGETYLNVDTRFNAIFTSNPEEYAGTHKSQDALRDRMITIDLDYFDRETEIAITKSKSKLTKEEAEKIVGIVRGLRETGVYDFAPTVRGCIMVARALKTSGASVIAKDKDFRQICRDVLSSETSRLGEKTSQEKVKKIVDKLIDHYCGTDNGQLRKQRSELLKSLKVFQPEEEIMPVKERQLV